MADALDCDIEPVYYLPVPLAKRTGCGILSSRLIRRHVINLIKGYTANGDLVYPFYCILPFLENVLWVISIYEDS